MKKILLVLTGLLLMGTFLYGCSPAGAISEETVISTDENMQTEATARLETDQPADQAAQALPAGKETGFRMVSDGEYIYYSQYREPGLRKISMDLSSETLLADEDCIYLNLVGDMLYYVTPDSGIWQIKTDGSERKQLEISVDASWLDYDDGFLFFIQNYNIYRFDLENADESITDLEEENGAAAAADDTAYLHSEKILDEYVGSLAASGGQIFFTASPENVNLLYRMDENGGEPVIIASGVDTRIAIEGDRLYYAEEDPMTADHDVNTRLCSVDLSGNDRKLYFEELNAGAYFSVSGVNLYFTRFLTHEDDDFELAYLFRINTASGEMEEIYEQIDVMDSLEAAGDYIWLNHYSYETEITSDYWGKTDGSRIDMLANLRPEAGRSAYLDPYVEPYGPGESYLSLSTSSMAACYKLVRVDGTAEFVEFLEPNTSKTVQFPYGRYTLKIAEGNEWLGDDLAFGEDGYYSTTDLFNFEEGYTYEIVSSDTGSFAADSLDGFLD